MSEEEYLLTLSKALEVLVKDIDGPLMKETRVYLKTVQEAAPHLTHDEEWKNEQMNLMEGFIYEYFKKELLNFGFSGKICKNNPSFIDFLKALS